VSLPAPADPVLEVAGAVHAYGARQVLRGVDLRLCAGEIYALLGPNGAGKTTLARAICGRFEPDDGTVRIDGRNPYRDRHARTALGLAPQSVALYPQLTVAENLEAFGRLAGLKGPALRAAVQEAMEVTRTDERAGALVRTLSGGLQRRVNIAAAILAHPKLLVLDEPTVGVDLAAREAVADVLRRLKARGVAVLIITHDLDEAAELADRVGFLIRGRKVAEGTPAELIAEAFDDRMEVQADVSPDLPADARARLHDAGLTEGGRPGAWSCFATDGYARAASLDSQLKAAGVAVREIHVRRPSLEHLFERLIAEDAP